MSRLRSKNLLANDLPSILKMDLSDEQVTSYLSDLFAGATGISIRVKDSAQAEFRSGGRLSELHVDLLNKHIWGAEIEYEFRGAQWVDILSVHRHSVRLSRQSMPAVLTA